MGPKKAAAPKLPPSLPKGHVLYDRNKKRHWTLGKQVGAGGFGRIYEATCSETSALAVIKMEHVHSGPLFCEQNFAVRCLRKDEITTWIKQRQLDHVPLPEFYSFGVTDDGQFRFVAMQRLGRNLEEFLTKFNWHLPEILAYQIAVEMTNALEFIHCHGYVHADIKGSNIILGYGKEETKRVYLCDFGLAARVSAVYKEDKKLKHNGTLEYTSREAHRGAAPSPRGDIEILAYCLLHWMNGSLPWGSKLTNPEAVSTAKHAFFDQLPKSLKQVFPQCPPEIVDIFSLVARMPYENAPDHNAIRKIFMKGLSCRKAHLSQPFVLTPSKSKPPTAPKVSSALSPITRSHAVDSKIRDEPEKPPARKKSYVTHGPLAIAIARSKQKTVGSSSKINAAEANGHKAELKRKYESPIRTLTARNSPRDSSARKAKNPQPLYYNNYSDEEEDDRSILYKTALPEFMPSSSEESEEKTPPKPAVRPRRVAGTRK